MPGGIRLRYMARIFFKSCDEKQPSDLLMILFGYQYRKHFHYYIQLKKNLSSNVKLANLKFTSRSNLSLLLFKLLWSDCDWSYCYSDQFRLLIMRELKTRENKIARKYSFVYRKLFLFFKYAHAMILWKCYYTYLKNHPSFLIGVWSGAKFRSQLLAFAATSLNRKRVYFENGLLPDTMTMDDLGVNNNNSLPRTADFYLNYWSAAKKNRMTTKPLNRLTPLKNTPAASVISPASLPEHYIFVPFQIDTDAQIINHSDWISRMRDLFFLLSDIRPLLIDERLCFVIKEHPLSKENYTKLHKTAAADRHFSYPIFASGYSVQTLIEHARGVLTINSTVGMEALLLRQKVITLGNACYNIPGLVRHADDRDSLIRHINTLDAWEPNADLRKAFLSYVYHYYCIPRTRDNPTGEHWVAINERLKKMLASQPWLPGIQIGQ